MKQLKSVYHWTLRQAEKPYAAAMLFMMAVVEACLFPLPPDLLLIPMSIARRQKALKFAVICTLGSVIGGVIGYGIGALMMATIGQWIVDTYHLQTAFEHFRHGFQKYGMWIILAKGLTPIPFILVTIASGVTHLNLGVFILSATLTRGARFFLEAILIYYFGEPIRHFIERHLTWIALAVLGALLFGFWIVLH